MDPVAYDLNMHVVQQISALNHSKNPVTVFTVNRGHSGIKMSQMAIACVKGFSYHIIIRVGVCDGGQDAKLYQSIPQFDHAGNFRSRGPPPDIPAAAVDDLVKMMRKWDRHAFSRLRAGLFRGKIWPFQMKPQQMRHIFTYRFRLFKTVEQLK